MCRAEITQNRGKQMVSVLDKGWERNIETRVIQEKTEYTVNLKKHFFEGVWVNIVHFFAISRYES